ncbi:hypothetical protein [Streptomyces sp. NPDC056287]|uniref:hypothetical protein n=1 Tax=Streptomyces sp. NPDC056287 TaxID=3345770 RepID=UPI0035E16B94
MNAKRVNAAAGVIHAAQKTRQTAAGIAMCLEAAGLLQSPESAAEQLALLAEVDGLRARVAEAVAAVACLEQKRVELERIANAERARVAELEVATYVAPSPSCTRCYGADAVRFVANGGTTAPCFVCGPSQVDRLRAQVAELEAQHAAVLALHRKHNDSDHCFADDETWPCNTRTALGQTVPEPPSPWERAVAGLNALVDADVIFHVEPDGHISAPFSDEHIEWDLKAKRWVLTHDEDSYAQAVAAYLSTPYTVDTTPATPVEDPHDSPLHHEYRLGRDLDGTCDACGDGPSLWCPDCAACRKGCHGGHDGSCTHPNAPWGGAS